ncbi:hypothetical protein T484DRAFT_1761946 [Baffinella frigidus]|nr:hypothetical protein T484DRAFT_1761946 [Cryptophyta sp. CCMP2293]
MALLCLTERGVPRKDEDEASRWMEKAAKAGNPDALYNMGVMALYGRGVAESIEVMNPPSNFELYKMGVMALYGSGVPESIEVAMHHFQAAAEAGSREAQFHLGATFEQCAEEIVRMWNTPGMFGDGDSLAEVANRRLPLDEESRKIPPLRIALAWYSKAGELGHGMAQHRAAILVGQGVQPAGGSKTGQKQWFDGPSAVTWMLAPTAAARLRTARPTSMLPSVVTNALFRVVVAGMGEVDRALEAEWHRRAAANNVLASSYAYGWHRRAAANNVLASSSAYGVHFQEGVGCGKDIDAALTYFAAAAVGHKADVEGSLLALQFFCPFCQVWHRNAPSAEQPKGDTRCSKCREERVFPKTVVCFCASLPTTVDEIHPAVEELRRAVTAASTGNRSNLTTPNHTRPPTGAIENISRPPTGETNVLRVGSGGSDVKTPGGGMGRMSSGVRATSSTQEEQEETPSIWEEVA